MAQELALQLGAFPGLRSWAPSDATPIMSERRCHQFGCASFYVYHRAAASVRGTRRARRDVRDGWTMRGVARRMRPDSTLCSGLSIAARIGDYAGDPRPRRISSRPEANGELPQTYHLPSGDRRAMIPPRTRCLRWWTAKPLADCRGGLALLPFPVCAGYGSAGHQGAI